MDTQKLVTHSFNSNDPSRSPLLRALADACGIDFEWRDDWGNLIVVPDQTLEKLLVAFGVIPAEASPELRLENCLESCKRSNWLETFEPVYVFSTPPQAMTVRPHLSIVMPAGSRLSWILQEESGMIHKGIAVAEHLPVSEMFHRAGGTLLRCQLDLDLELPWGYHELKAAFLPGEGITPGVAATTVIVAPDSCFLPEDLEIGRGLWGPQVRLESLTSPRNWGIGDLTDLRDLLTWCDEQGAGLLSTGSMQSINLHNNKPTDADQEGARPPFLPSSRSALNFLFLDVESVPGYEEEQETIKRLWTSEGCPLPEQLRQESRINLQAVARLKLLALSILFQHFQKNHLVPLTDLGCSFRTFQNQKGRQLAEYSTFASLQEFFGKQGNGNWCDWPEPFSRGDRQSIEDFETEQAERLEFYQFLQWLTGLQLQQAQLTSRDQGLPVGLCLELPLLVERNGAETWQPGDLFARSLKAGLPPGKQNLVGACWDAAFTLPSRLRKAAYAPFIQAVRQSMSFAGAIQVPAGSGLFRVFCIPEDCSPSEGTWVHYRPNELLSILALESQRNRCLVILADLSEVESKSAAYERRRFILQKNLNPEKLNFSRTDFKSPDRTVLVPDKPLVAFWEGRRPRTNAQELSPELRTLRDQLVKERVISRVALLQGLEDQGLLPQGCTTDPASVPVLSTELSVAIYALLARTTSLFVLFRLEDIIHAGAPSGQKLVLEVSQLSEDQQLQVLAEKMRSERGSAFPSAAAEKSLAEVPAALKLPQATYRLQLNNRFTFQDARALVPYLSNLGISHIYSSPFFKSRPESQHGYDIVDHGELNPELGTARDLDALVSTLHAHNMGLILDFVPNHMAASNYNKWWMDVLENGPASPFASCFDIDWTPVKKELWGKVLLPILGESYGRILKKGQLQVSFCSATGSFDLHYWEKTLPLSPTSYWLILEATEDVLARSLGAGHPDLLEYESVVAALKKLEPAALPGGSNGNGSAKKAGDNLSEIARQTGQQRRSREREIRVCKARLAALCARNPAVEDFIKQRLLRFDCRNEDSSCQTELHKLLELQSYRLSYWRVAADEINYRRFFDIIDLAAVRVEDPQVFSAMHALVFKLVEQGKIDGLRIDHPDGLYDPAIYLWRLQQEVGKRLRTVRDFSFREEFLWQDLPFYVVAEKVLAFHEHMKHDWATHGTTGYDFLTTLNSVMVDMRSEPVFTQLYERLTGNASSYAEQVKECKRVVLQSALSSELLVLAHKLSRIAESSWFYRDFTLNSLRQALREIIIHFPVYRTYAAPDRVGALARRYVSWAVNAARSKSPAEDTSIYDFIENVLLLEPVEGIDSSNKALEDFTMKFQQLTSPVLAKSIEDTLFYRYQRFISLNEVGGEPNRFGASVSFFHHRNRQRQQRLPYSMLTTSTHDTKRSEDVRARLNVLSEIPDLWRKRVVRWVHLNQSKRVLIKDQPAPDRADEYLVYQTLIGACPLVADENALLEFAQRVEQYLLKATREAKVHTSWINQNQQYEQAVRNFVQGILRPQQDTSRAFLEDFLQLHAFVSRAGAAKSLSQVVLKLCSAGVPDIYQGNELWDFSLVDPDNRRPVDFNLRQHFLAKLQPWLSEPIPGIVGADKEGQEKAWSDLSRTDELQEFLSGCTRHWRDGLLKMFVTARLLSWRKKCPELFTTGKYMALAVQGPASQSVIAFARKHAHELALVVAPRLVVAPLANEDRLGFSQETMTQSGYDQTYLCLPRNLSGQSYINIFTGERQKADQGKIKLQELFGILPVAVFTADLS